MNGYILMFPFIFVTSMHLLTLLMEFTSKPYETINAFFILMESIFIAEIMNGEAILISVVLTIALLLWAFLYLKLIIYQR
jgi:hypothetical protein